MPTKKPPNNKVANSPLTSQEKINYFLITFVLIFFQYLSHLPSTTGGANQDCLYGLAIAVNR
jgi:hypothetical protein